MSHRRSIRHSQEWASLLLALALALCPGDARATELEAYDRHFDPLPRDEWSVPDFLEPELGVLPPGEIGQAAVAFLEPIARRELGSDEPLTLTCEGVTRVQGAASVHIGQRIHGLRVVGNRVIVHVDADGLVRTVRGSLVASTNLPRQAALDWPEALEQARARDRLAGHVVGTPELVYLKLRGDAPRLVWRVTLQRDGVPDTEPDEAFIDATSGRFVRPGLFGGLLGRL